jgi:hypothetical protein
MSDLFTGDIGAYRLDDGRIRLDVTPGSLRVSRLLVDQADREFLARDGDVLTFRGVDEAGEPVTYRYGVTGNAPGLEGGWLLCEPLS